MIYINSSDDCRHTFQDIVDVATVFCAVDMHAEFISGLSRVISNHDRNMKAPLAGAACETIAVQMMIDLMQYLMDAQKKTKVVIDRFEKIVADDPALANAVAAAAKSCASGEQKWSDPDLIKKVGSSPGLGPDIVSGADRSGKTEGDEAIAGNYFSHNTQEI